MMPDLLWIPAFAGMTCFSNYCVCVLCAFALSQSCTGFLCALCVSAAKKSVGSGQNGGSRPVSRVLSWTAIHLGCASPRTSSNLPGNHAGRMNVPLFGLAPGGVYPAAPVTSRAVRSYRTISPLPAPERRRYIFCGTFHGLAPSRRYLAPCPVEPGLSSSHGEATVWPTPGSHYTACEYRQQLPAKKQPHHAAAYLWSDCRI